MEYLNHKRRKTQSTDPMVEEVGMLDGKLPVVRVTPTTVIVDCRCGASPDSDSESSCDSATEQEILEELQMQTLQTASVEELEAAIAKAKEKVERLTAYYTAVILRSIRNTQGEAISQKPLAESGSFPLQDFIDMITEEICY